MNDEISLELKSPTRARLVSEAIPLLTGIISGGQSGADLAALRAAFTLGLATGGFAPLGWRTTRGPMPTLGTGYGLVESWSASYKPRTMRNVFAADATVRIASDFNSSGERCTLNAIQMYKKPYFNVPVETLPKVGLSFSDHCLAWEKSYGPELIVFLIRNKVGVLNVAGNSEETSPGIEAMVERFLVSVLS